MTAIEHIEQLVSQYGYLAVALGGAIEGESIILTASMFAARGLLDIRYVALIAFLTSTIADQSLFFLGKLWSSYWNRFALLESVRPKIVLAISKYPRSLILGFRFVYGIRTATPLNIGSVDFPTSTFCKLNTIAAILWTVLSCGTGYFCGQYIALHSYALVAFTLVAYFALLWLLHRTLSNIQH